MTESVITYQHYLDLKDLIDRCFNKLPREDLEKCYFKISDKNEEKFNISLNFTVLRTDDT